MSKLKKFANFFVTIESDGSEVPADAASPDPDRAARAAKERAEAGPVGKPVQKRVADLPEVNFDDDDFDIEALERELASRPEPPKPQRTGVFAQAAPTAPPKPTVSNAVGRNASFDPLPFEDIYSREGLPGELSSDFTVYTIEQLLANPHLANLPESTKTASLMVALQARNVTVGEVIEDARKRDHALDEHDAELMHTLLELEEVVVERNKEVEDRINALLEELRVEIESNNFQLAEAKELYREWKKNKVEEEERLFKTIRHLVEPGASNPVSVDN